MVRYHAQPRSRPRLVASNFADPTGLLFDIPGTPSTEEFFENVVENSEKVGTRLVGFVNGFTQPVFGGTAALGLGNLVNTCSAEYQLAHEIGGYTLDAEGAASVVYGVVYGAGEAGYASATKTDIGNSLFGRVYRGIGTGPAGSDAVTGSLNTGTIRVGLGWRGDAQAGQNIFRIGIGESHFDFFH